jgi:hypothetical protein
LDSRFLYYSILPTKKTRVAENNARHNLGYLKGKILIKLYFFPKNDSKSENPKIKPNNLTQTPVPHRFHYSNNVKIIH